MACTICQVGNVTRAHKKVACDHCYRELCLLCGNPILLTQSNRKTVKGRMHMGACPALRMDIPLEKQWKQVALPISL
jgi:hypothetical protein